PLVAVRRVGHAQLGRRRGQQRSQVLGAGKGVAVGGQHRAVGGVQGKVEEEVGVETRQVPAQVGQAGGGIGRQRVRAVGRGGGAAVGGDEGGAQGQRAERLGPRVVGPHLRLKSRLVG